MINRYTYLAKHREKHGVLTTSGMVHGRSLKQAVIAAIKQVQAEELPANFTSVTLTVRLSKPSKH